MTVIRTRHDHDTKITRGAVPLGQHSHSPDAVLGPVLVPTLNDGTFPGLPTPAPRAMACCACGRGAALVHPTTQAGYCARCWLRECVQGELA